MLFAIVTVVVPLIIAGLAGAGLLCKADKLRKSVAGVFRDLVVFCYGQFEMGFVPRFSLLHRMGSSDPARCPYAYIKQLAFERG